MTGHATSDRAAELPRWLAQMRADFFGYFWLPCPACGRHFGGFEIGEDVGWTAELGVFDTSGAVPVTSWACVCRRHEATR